MQRFDDDIDGPDFDDGSSSRYDDERNEMLRVFSEQLCGDPRTIRYDEEEWIMLADYADDVDNFYLFSEAVIRGLQAFPDSAELADRHLMLLNRICRSDELRTAFDAAAARPGASKIARLYNYFYHWTDPDDKFIPVGQDAHYNNIRAIMLDGESLTDQEVIEAVRVLAEMGLTRIVADDMDLWTRMTDFPETFRYELAATAFEHYDSDTALRMADILVEEYPYNFRYWILRCRIEMLKAAEVTDKDEASLYYDEAINSVDTALAINPDDTEAAALRNNIDIQRVRCARKNGADTTSIMVDTNGNVIDVKTFLKATPVDLIISRMSVEMLVYLFDSNNDDARAIIAEWVKHEFESCDSCNSLSIPRIYAFTIALYVLDRVNDVDFVLDAAREACKTGSFYEELMPIELVRHIETSRLDEADRLMTAVERIYGVGDASIAVLRAILDRRRGRQLRADNAYDTYRHSAVDHLTNITFPANERVFDDNIEQITSEIHTPGAIDTVTAHFLTRLALGRL